MKQTTKMSRAVSQLEHIYNNLNADYYAGELPTPIITVQSKPGTYGHCTTAKVWRRADGGTYELNIAAEVLNYPIEETLDTMLHVYICIAESAESRKSAGEVSITTANSNPLRRLTASPVCPAGQYGWNTTPGDNLVEYALSKGWNEIKIGGSACRP